MENKRHGICPHKSIKRRYQIDCARRVSGITFIWHAQYRKIGKGDNLKVFGSNKPTDLNRITNNRLM